eukprot:365298-Chlamydomonas_euryale.AAC.13
MRLVRGAAELLLSGRPPLMLLTPPADLERCRAPTDASADHRLPGFDHELQIAARRAGADAG